MKKEGKPDIGFRIAEPQDTPLVFRFIKDLAEFEDKLHEVVATEEILKEKLFGKRRFAEVVFAILDGREVGFALFFHNFSTFLGKPGIYLEDLYVLPEFRKRGVGKALLKWLANLAIERDCGRMEWWVLNWNPARKFYESLGAIAMDEWKVYRLTGESLKNLANEK